MRDKFDGQEFEWDPDKAEAVRIARGITFREALTVFANPLAATTYDGDHSDEEEQFETIGRSRAGRLLVVMHTSRAARIRIITVRTPTRAEQRDYEEGD